MTAVSIRVAAASLFAIAVAGCTTTGIGTGQSANGRLGATFTWTENGGTITQESRVYDYGPLWNGWGPGWGWGGGWGGRRWGYGWGGWGPWGPNEETITHYTGQVLANLQGPGGFMRCDFRLMSPSSGMAGGGIGRCQLRIADTSRGGSKSARCGSGLSRGKARQWPRRCAASRRTRTRSMI